MKKASKVVRSAVVGVSGGKSREEDSAPDRPWRHGCLFGPHDYFFTTKGECFRVRVRRGGER